VLCRHLWTRWGSVTDLDPLAIQHACAVLIAFCFWGAFRFSRVTQGRLATSRHAPLVIVIGGAVMAAAAYSHEAIALNVATLVLCLMGHNHSRAAFAKALGAEVFQERAVELLRAQGSVPYLRTIGMGIVPWVLFGAILLAASRGRADSLYWVATGLLAAQGIAFLSALQFVRVARSQADAVPDSSITE